MSQQNLKKYFNDFAVVSSGLPSVIILETKISWIFGTFKDYKILIIWFQEDPFIP